MKPARVVTLIVAMIAIVGSAAVAPAAVSQAATPRTATTTTAFTGDWIGHTRDLVISRAGNAKESISSGCCDRVISLRYTLTHAHGTKRDAAAVARVTKVHVYDKTEFTAADPAPHVGEVRKVHIHHGVLTDPFTKTPFCDDAAEAKGRCGA